MKITKKQLTKATIMTIAGLTMMPTLSASALTAAQTQRLQTIISKGDTEITRRLTSLNAISTKINGTTKLTASDKTTLASQVTNENSGLTTLKTKLDAETTVEAAGTDAKSILSDYRVYALILPKVALIRDADDQQVVEMKATDAITKLQTNLTAAKNANKDVTALQAKLDDATAKNQPASTISGSIESKVIALQPSDYDSDHTILSGDRDQLKTSRTDLQTVVSDLKVVRDGLKTS